MAYVGVTAIPFLASLERYEQSRSEDHGVDKVLPADIGIVHSYRNFGFEVKQGHPRFAERYEKWDAVCGHRVKVLLPQPFDGSDNDACPRCAEAAIQNAPSGPPQRD